jgi:hypothetical protein
MLKLQPGTTYRVSLDYLCDTPDCFAFLAGYDGDANEKISSKYPMTDASWKVKRFTATFTTDAQEGWFIGITKLDQQKHGTIVIDNVLVEKLDSPVARR